jgi:hypothetical protein
MLSTRTKPIIRLKDPRRFLLQTQIFKTFEQTRPHPVYDNYLYSVYLNPKDIDLVKEQTYAATEDDVLHNLLTCWEVVTIKNGKEKTPVRKYSIQAIAIITHHAKTGQVNDFVIKESDLRRPLRKRLTIEKIGGTPKQYRKIVETIISRAVRRLFEELDLVYYYDHLADKLGVRFIT